MGSKSKWGVVLVIIMLISLLSIGLWLYTHNYLSNASLGDTTIVSVKHEGNLKEVKVMASDGFTYLYENGVQKQLITVVPNKLKSILVLPDMSNLEGKNTLIEKAPISEMTWSSTLQDSAEYLKNLQNDGYTLKQIASTSQYIEYFLQKGESIQRVVVFQTSIMVGELADGASIPSVDSYFKNYIK